MIRQTEFFLYSDKDQEAFDNARNGTPLSGDHRLDPGRPRTTSAGQGDGPQGNRHADLGSRTTTSSRSSSSRAGREAMDRYCEMVNAALDLGIVPRCHFEDITRADIYGFFIPFAIELMQLSEQCSGIDIKIRLCDTMGYGVTYPGAALPRSVPQADHGPDRRRRRARRPARMARPQRLPQGAHQRHHRLALRLRRGQRHPVRLRRADRQPAARRADHRVHRLLGRN